MIATIYETAADRDEYILFKKTGYHEALKFPPSTHFHNSVEFTFVTKGNLSLSINAEARNLTRGDVAFINCFDVHKYAPDADCEYFIVLISSDFFDERNNLGSAAFPSFMEKSADFEKILEFLEYSYSVWEGSDRLFKSGFVNMLLGLMRKFYPAENLPKSRQDELLISVLKYVNESYGDKITLRSTAAKYGYTANYFSLAFRRCIGISFNEYLSRCRINAYFKIKEQSPDKKISQIMESCGFSSANTFYRALKKWGKP